MRFLNLGTLWILHLRTPLLSPEAGDVLVIMFLHAGLQPQEQGDIASGKEDNTNYYGEN